MNEEERTSPLESCALAIEVVCVINALTLSVSFSFAVPFKAYFGTQKLSSQVVSLRGANKWEKRLGGNR